MNGDRMASVSVGEYVGRSPEEVCSQAEEDGRTYPWLAVSTTCDAYNRAV
jgi:hypothetical protein